MLILCYHDQSHDCHLASPAPRQRRLDDRLAQRSSTSWKGKSLFQIGVPAPVGDSMLMMDRIVGCGPARQACRGREAAEAGNAQAQAATVSSSESASESDRYVIGNYQDSGRRCPGLRLPVLLVCDGPGQAPARLAQTVSDRDRRITVTPSCL
jgi:hypothetical protein